MVWLQASPAEHMRRVMEQGDFRPMAHNRDAMNDLVAILDARAALYGRSHARLDTSGKTVEACVEELVKIARELFASNLDRLSPAGWDRLVIYTYPHRAERSLRWLAIHTEHEVVHHLLDVRRQLTGAGSGRP